MEKDTCHDVFPNTDGKCDEKACKSMCFKKWGKGVSRCNNAGGGHMHCSCRHHCP